MLKRQVVRLGGYWKRQPQPPYQMRRLPLPKQQLRRLQYADGRQPVQKKGRPLKRTPPTLVCRKRARNRLPDGDGRRKRRQVLGDKREVLLDVDVAAPQKQKQLVLHKRNQRRQLAPPPPPVAPLVLRLTLLLAKSVFQKERTLLPADFSPPRKSAGL